MSLPIISEKQTCDPACTNDNTCSGTDCICGNGAACTGDQICKNGKCGKYLDLINILIRLKTVIC